MNHLTLALKIAAALLKLLAAPTSATRPGSIIEADLAHSLAVGVAAGATADVTKLSAALSLALESFGVEIDPQILSGLIGILALLWQIVARYLNGPTPAPRP